jgi:hypothetical protein
MTAIRDLQRDIADRLGHKQSFRGIAKKIANCERGACTRCGDACPIRAARWFQDHTTSLQRLFRKKAQIRQFHFGRNTWSSEPGHLADTDVKTIFKATRRALDTLQEPSIIAVGMADAYWSLTEWRVGAAVIVAAPASVDIYRAFDHTKDIAGPLEIVSVTDVSAALEKLFTGSQRAKRGGPSEDERVRPKNKLRAEYYSWLASMEPGERVFRYGCDRYFNQLKKTRRLLHLRPKKGHPYPFWLRDQMFGNHAWNCQCKPCQGG